MFLVVLLTCGRPYEAFIDIIHLIFAYFLTIVAYVVYIEMMKRMAEEEY